MQKGLLMLTCLLAVGFAIYTEVNGQESSSTTVAVEVSTTEKPIDSSSVGPTTEGQGTDSSAYTPTTEESGTSTIGSTTTEDDRVCQSTTEMWGDDDIRNFYFCMNGKVVGGSCEEGSYFVNNATVAGCIPTDKMDPHCVNNDITVHTCEGDYLKQPQPSTELGNFYLCTEQGQQPIEIACPNNMAFVNQNGYLGCFEWAMWHEIRNC